MRTSQRNLLMVITLLICASCSNKSSEPVKTPISKNDIQGKLISEAYSVDYSKDEKPFGTIALKKLSQTGDCEDIPLESEHPTEDMTGKVKVHATIVELSFEAHTEIEFFRGKDLVGRTCKQAPRSGKVVLSNGEATLLDSFDGTDHKVYKIQKKTNGQLTITEESFGT